MISIIFINIIIITVYPESEKLTHICLISRNQFLKFMHFIIYYYIYVFIKFLFYIRVYLINNVVLVSGVQQTDSVIHIHVSILFQIIFLFRLLQNIEQSSLCYAIGPCWLSI